MPHGIYWTILIICWGGLGLFWLAGWLYNLWKASAVQQRSGFLPLWIVGIALVWLMTMLLRHNALEFMTFIIPWLQIAGAFLLIAGTAFTLWARWVLGTMWAAIAEIKEDHQLRTGGPYRITRHPIYTGLLCMLLGSMLIGGFGIWILYFIAGLLAIIIKATSEERLLQATFGEQYIQYQQHVPRFIPGLQLHSRSH